MGLMDTEIPSVITPMGHNDSSILHREHTSSCSPKDAPTAKMVLQAGALQSANNNSKGSSPSCLQLLENPTRRMQGQHRESSKVSDRASKNARFGRSRERMELMEWFGWQGMLKAHPAPSGMDTFHKPRLLQALMNMVWEFWGLELCSRLSILCTEGTTPNIHL